eukprot:TRINITY_DN20228_c0_g1_i2.p2 TRINITY_DN20228_c0_g1~~TRINITY_DN20228_c0_g1_i2.p2  ORF type:complete len:226 (+),score=70.23 TRINITY_DN20228_c0_g1_i2:211-888(+)
MRVARRAAGRPLLRSFATTGGGVRRPPESAEEMRDARRVVDGTDWQTVRRPDLRVEYCIQRGWSTTVTGPTYTSNGESITELSMQVEGVELTQTLSTMLSISTCRFPLDIATDRRVAVPCPRLLQGHWFDHFLTTVSPADRWDLRRLSYPCTPLYDEDPQGSWAWSTCMLGRSHDMEAVHYWRFLYHPDADQFYVVSAAGTKQSMEHHLTHRWLALHLLHGVRPL